MKNIINLTKGFQPVHGNHIVDFELFTFNGGEPHVKLGHIFDEHDVVITSRVKSFNDIGNIAVVNDALQRKGGYEKKELVIPYFPGARQDRVANEGEALTVKVYADMINVMGFDKVTIFDPHSDVTPALLNNCNVVNNHALVKQAIHKTRSGRCTIISPDAGANKKANSLLHNIFTYFTPNTNGTEDIVYCDKNRDIQTGELSGFKVYSEDLKGAACIIVDDICDGGGTFIGLAEELKAKNAGDLYLVVSHGIFSKGFVELSQHFKAIYTTDSWCSNYAMEIPEIERKSEKCTIINLNTIL